MTELLRRLQTGDREAMDLIMPLVYEELKKLARSHVRREAQPAPLEATALVHEAFLKMAGGRHPYYENRSHFYGVVSRLMRQVLVDTARARSAVKRGAALEVPLANLPDRAPEPERSLLALEESLRRLEETDPRKAKLIEMRYFGGLTAEESAAAFSMPVHVVRRELRLGQAWLRKEMAGDHHAGTFRQSETIVAPAA